MIKTFTQLFESHCRPLEGGKAMSDVMDDDAVRAQLVELPEWDSDGKRIHRTYEFANYWEVIAFVNAIASTIHSEDHHPELTVGYNKVEARFDTHSIGGISINDFICASKCDAAYANRPHLPKAAP